MILLITWSGSGILDSGNINPDSKITGSINPISEIIKALCCVSAIVEIKTPKVSEVMMNKILSNPNKNKLPTTGTLKTKMLRTMITMALMIDKNM